MKSNDILFCSGKKCCPIISTYENTPFKVLLHDDDEDQPRKFEFKKSEFKDFVEAAKSGAFDKVLI